MSLRPYQEQAVDFLLSHRRAIYGHAAGSGKTPTTLVALEKACPWRTLCVAPKSVLSHWAEEAAIWYPGLRVVPGWGTPTQRAAARADVAAMPEMPTMLLANYEVVRQDIDALEQITWGAMVIDEAHRLKNRNAMITKYTKRLTKHPRMWLWMLSGTPFPNRPQEIWSLLNLIDRHRFSSYWRWVESHCEVERLQTYKKMSYPAPKIIAGLRDGAEERVRSQLEDVLLYASLDDLLPDLPEATITPMFVDLDAEERRVYQDLEKRAWADIDGLVVKTGNEISRMTRLRQVVSSMDVFGGERTKPGSKIAAALELISDLEPEQVLVLSWSRAAAERVASEIGTGAAYIHGGVGAAERDVILRAFTSGKVRVLAGTLATLGEGVDGMQVARHLIRLDRDWVPARNAQALARIRRSGQLHDAVFCWDLIARGTLDETIEQALRDKTDVIDALLAQRTQP